MKNWVMEYVSYDDRQNPHWKTVSAKVDKDRWIGFNHMLYKGSLLLMARKMKVMQEEFFSMSFSIRNTATDERLWLDGRGELVSALTFFPKGTVINAARLASKRKVR